MARILVCLPELERPSACRLIIESSSLRYRNNYVYYMRKEQLKAVIGDQTAGMCAFAHNEIHLYNLYIRIVLHSVKFPTVHLLRQTIFQKINKHMISTDHNSYTMAFPYLTLTSLFHFVNFEREMLKIRCI